MLLEMGQSIVFCNTRAGTDSVTRALQVRRDTTHHDSIPVKDGSLLVPFSFIYVRRVVLAVQTSTPNSWVVNAMHAWRNFGLEKTRY